ncbi:hypothetical protein DPMN_080051 [Dreissena polymorpha]|uniref:Uncharacterized protein n=1 Tax=Dreissena polymorpha TaxID=45954 RepID=A0A9D4BQM7_DREPO|nr:hypothetical protein DPMN_080051 [Dreissena polymorpha]
MPPARRCPPRRKTDGRTDGQFKNYMPPFGGIKMLSLDKGCWHRLTIIANSVPFVLRKLPVLTKFHEDWTKNVSSRLFTCFHYTHIEKTAPPPGGHVFPPIMTIFNFSKQVTSRSVHIFHYIHIEKTAPFPGSHVFSTIWTIFELVRDTSFMMIGQKLNTSPLPGGYVFQRTGTVF